MTLSASPLEVRRWVRVDPEAYGHDGFFSKTIFSDTVWCGHCGRQMGGVYGGTIAASVAEHRKECLWVQEGEPRTVVLGPTA